MTPRDIPTLFTGAMVRAIRAGHKTQTRRLITPRNTEFTSAPKAYWDHANFDTAFVDGDKTAGYLHVHCHRDDGDMSCAECTRMGWEGTTHRLRPRVERGDSLWIREAYAFIDNSAFGQPSYFQYRADTDGKCLPGDWPDEERDNPDRPKWKSPRYMPRAFSRIIREVTEVRIERLQSISEEDAIAEGAEPILVPPDGGSSPHIEGFRELWCRINSPASWSANPWVVVTTFRCVDQGER